LRCDNGHNAWNSLISPRLLVATMSLPKCAFLPIILLEELSIFPRLVAISQPSLTTPKATTPFAENFSGTPLLSYLFSLRNVPMKSTLSLVSYDIFCHSRKVPFPPVPLPWHTLRPLVFILPPNCEQKSLNTLS